MSCPQQEDTDFAAFQRTRDPEALGRVFDAVAGELYRVALDLSGHPTDAEDLLQGCFLAAIEKAERYDASKPVRPWLFGILTNQARRARGRRARRGLQEDALPQLQTAETNPQADASYEELVGHLDRALHHLPEAARSVLLLRLKHGLSIAAIAESLGARERLARSADQFAHMHNVRLRWLKHAAPKMISGTAPFPKDADKTKAALRKELKASAKLIARFLEVSEEAGAVKSWNGPPATFLGYLVAHEAHHRGLALVALRLNGHKMPQKVVYGLWQWGKRRNMR